ncbi:complex I subunit 1/NuoH family protein [Thermogemmatispora sp.]|uniref:complex I subunit 1/NuoH family protein n=1 Tax=Thermogemmatispora sp. TaxID=1968838 RepID=UPI001DFCFD9E|nr:complex I subunit 1 family protein [Thermogemmatispora sp.]MBX5449095.1 NADH-quinone oxidoreductase subunit H [Thermogemmatispora sp.]
MSGGVVLAEVWWEQLLHGILSWEFLQFVVAFASIFGFVMTSAVILILAERKVMAWMQDRYGPLHTGPWGLLQTVADVGKLLLKEDIHAGKIDKAVFILAPSVFLAPVIASFAVLPFSPYISLPGAPLATGIVYLIAMSSLDVVGVIMAGWGSNNKYALIGGLRSAAQMISYELPLVLSLVSVIMLTSILRDSGIGTIAIKDIMNFQMAQNWPGKGNPVWDFIFEGFTPWAWFILVQPLLVVIYYTCGLAETNRSPFDLPEAESELVAGYLTEYSGMRWALFFLGEYGNMTIVSAITAMLFLGGWSGPGVAFLTAPGMAIGWQVLGNLLALFYFILKIYLLCGVFIWVRTTLPRLRADQLMQFAWLILIPTTLVNIVLTGALYLVLNALGASNLVFLIVLGVVNWLMLFGFFWVVSRATTASTRRAMAPAIRARQRLAALTAAPSAPRLPEPERTGVTGAGATSGR